MTLAQLIAYYSNLLVIQYRQKPKAYAHIGALVTPALMDQLPLAVQNAYNLNTAVGVQLDILGKYVGISRTNNGFNGPISLNDADYLKLIQLKIVSNSSGSSLATIQALLNQYFPGAILVFDYQDMRMSYYLSPSIGSLALAQIFVVSRLLPKPMGVQLGVTIYSPDIFEFFGCRSYDFVAMNVSPLNNYDTYNMDYPWLTYDNAFAA